MSWIRGENDSHALEEIEEILCRWVARFEKSTDADAPENAEAARRVLKACRARAADLSLPRHLVAVTD